MSSAVRLIAITPALFWVAGRGIEIVAAVQVAIGLIFIPANRLILARLLGLGARGLWRMLLPQLLGVAALGTVVAAVYAVPTARIAAGHPAGATLLAALAWCNPALLARCIESLRRIVQSRRRLAIGSR